MNRRDFLVKSGVAAATSVSLGPQGIAQSATIKGGTKPSGKKPNIILYLSDQFRWDFVGANGANSSTKTPNLDAMAKRGKNFTHAVTNQPVCAPARSVLMTS